MAKKRVRGSALKRLRAQAQKSLHALMDPNEFSGATADKRQEMRFLENTRHRLRMEYAQNLATQVDTQREKSLLEQQASLDMEQAKAAQRQEQLKQLTQRQEELQREQSILLQEQERLRAANKHVYEEQEVLQKELGQVKKAQSILLIKHAKLRADKENLEKALRQVREEREQPKSESFGVHISLDSLHNDQRSLTQISTTTRLSPNNEASPNNLGLLGGSYLPPQHPLPPVPPPSSLRYMKREATGEESSSKRSRLS
jgi:chromosome segregation ATPase